MTSASSLTAEQREALRERACVARDCARDSIARSRELLELAADVATAAELRVALSLESRRALRVSVGAYVALLRQLDTPPERVIMEAKEVVADAVRLPDRRAQAVTALIVEWVIEAYYAA